MTVYKIQDVFSEYKECICYSLGIVEVRYIHDDGGMFLTFSSRVFDWGDTFK